MGWDIYGRCYLSSFQSFISPFQPCPTTTYHAMSSPTNSPKAHAQPIAIDTSGRSGSAVPNGRPRSNSLWSNPGLSPSSSPLSTNMSVLQTPSSLTYVPISHYAPPRAPQFPFAIVAILIAIVAHRLATLYSSSSYFDADYFYFSLSCSHPQ